MRSAVKIWRESRDRYLNLDKTGKVISFTKINSPPEGFGGVAYMVVIVELSSKKRVVGELVDQEIKIGDQVKGVLRRLGKVQKDEVIEYGVKWKKL